MIDISIKNKYKLIDGRNFSNPIKDKNTIDQIEFLFNLLGLENSSTDFDFYISIFKKPRRDRWHIKPILWFGDIIRKKLNKAVFFTNFVDIVNMLDSKDKQTNVLAMSLCIKNLSLNEFQAFEVLAKRNIEPFTKYIVYDSWLHNFQNTGICAVVSFSEHIRLSQKEMNK